MNLVFFGSSPFSIIVLEKLINLQPTTYNLQLVITTPNKPVGRHLKLTPNPVKLLAQQHSIKVIESLSDLTTYNLQPTTIALVAAYGKIIPQNILDKFNGQIYNIHPSLLPKYRGPSPLQQQILDSVTETGVTIIRLDSLMDHGPIVTQAKYEIRPDDTWITLGHRLFSLGTDLFLKDLPPTTYNLQPQDESLATYTHKLTRDSGFVPYENLNEVLSASQEDLLQSQIARKLRAFANWPGVWSINPEGQRVKLLSLHPIKTQIEGQ